MRFGELIDLRLEEAQAALGGVPLTVTWDFGDWPHFAKERGYGVTFPGNGACHMRYSIKMMRAPGDRADGVIRHEIGHVVDHLVPARELNQWGRRRGVRLANTPEIRADDIAEAIWGEPLRYDEIEVQSTSVGKVGRPKHLGA
tara:strand:- start:849 stop:1277 length:429 start_codon:yes stop_codon:yes gene_type:complete